MADAFSLSTLAITGFDDDPAKITEILGIEPTAVGHNGIVTLPSKQPKRFNGWWRDADPDRLTTGSDHDKGLSLLIGLLEGREQHFVRLREQIRP